MTKRYRDRDGEVWEELSGDRLLFAEFADGEPTSRAFGDTRSFVEENYGPLVEITAAGKSAVDFRRVEALRVAADALSKVNGEISNPPAALEGLARWLMGEAPADG